MSVYFPTNHTMGEGLGTLNLKPLNLQPNIKHIVYNCKRESESESTRTHHAVILFLASCEPDDPPAFLQSSRPPAAILLPTCRQPYKRPY